MVQAGSLYMTEDQSWESYESLHKFARSFRRDGYPCREYIMDLSLVSTDADHEIEQDAGDTVADKGKTELTLIAACDANTEANRNMRVDIYYYDADGVSHHAYTTTGADATDEVAFVDAEDGVTAVTDFYCFDQDSHGAVTGATTYGSCIYSAVAIGAATNLCIGITGAAAGIADPEICYAHVNTTKQYPLLADIYGVGQIWGEREADAVGDDGLVMTLQYVTPWGELKTATQTNTADHSAIIRYIDADGCYVGDYYRTRTLKTTAVTGKYYAVCDHDGANHYAFIEEGNWQSIHSAFFSLSSVHKSFIGKIEFKKSDATTVINVIMTATYRGDNASHTETWHFNAADMTIEILKEMEPLTPVTFVFGDDNVAHPTCDMKIYMLEV